MALFVKLDVTWVDSPKLLRAGVDGAGVHAILLCLAKRLESDGWVDLLLLRRYGATDELVDRLTMLDLIDVEGERVRPHGWLDRNPSQAAIGAKRASKREAAKAGNHRRWDHPGDVANCPICHPDGQVVAGSDRTTSQSDPAATPSHSPDTDTDLETDLRSHLTSVPDHPGFAGPRPPGLDIARAAAGSGDSLRAGEAT